MGAISAIRTREGIDAVPLLVKIIEGQKHRGDDVFGVVTPKESLFTGDLKDLDELGFSNSAIAYNLMRFETDDLPQPRMSGNLSLIVESDYLEFSGSLDDLLSHLSGETPERSLARFVSEFDGQYVITVLMREDIFAVRDPVGLKPLYYFANEKFAALSTERKGLWRLGVKDVRIFPPGCLWKIKQDKVPQPVRQILPSVTVRKNSSEICKELENLLRKAVSERSSRKRRIGVCFSGGLDSSIIAYLLSKLDVDLYAFIVGVKDQSEIEWAERAAELLGIATRVYECELEELEKTLKECIWRTEESNPVKLGIATPLCWSAQLSYRNGINTLFTGQGADELFAGYHKFLRTLTEGDMHSLANAIFENVRDANETSYSLGEKVAAAERVKMIHPFTDWELIEFGLSIPPEMKIQNAQDSLRKRILRRAAGKVGLPKQLVDIPKKAIQYSTGVDKEIKSLAKDKGLNTRSYLKNLFDAIFEDIHKS